MKRNLLKAVLLVGIFTIFGAISANAQKYISGKYVYVSFLKDNPVRASLELKNTGEAVLWMNKTEKGAVEKIQNGNWKYDKSKKMISLTLPDTKDNLIFREEIMTFKVVGKKLKYVKPEYKEDIFGDFVKISSNKRK